MDHGKHGIKGAKKKPANPCGAAKHRPGSTKKILTFPKK